MFFVPMHPARVTDNAAATSRMLLVSIFIPLLLQVWIYGGDVAVLRGPGYGTEHLIGKHESTVRPRRFAVAHIGGGG
jgi:hypothetical protein